MLLIYNNLAQFNLLFSTMHPFTIQNLLGLPADEFRAQSPASTIELSDDSPSPNPTIVLSSDDEEEHETCNMEEVGKV